MELECLIMTVKSKEHGLWDAKNEQNEAGMSNNDHKEQEQGLWNAKKEQNGPEMRNNDP